jgi:hypothetical protein
MTSKSKRCFIFCHDYEHLRYIESISGSKWPMKYKKCRICNKTTKPSIDHDFNYLENQNIPVFDYSTKLQLNKKDKN